MSIAERRTRRCAYGTAGLRSYTLLAGKPIGHSGRMLATTMQSSPCNTVMLRTCCVGLPWCHQHQQQGQSCYPDRHGCRCTGACVQRSTKVTSQLPAKGKGSKGGAGEEARSW
jgi:hypothetical protein